MFMKVPAFDAQFTLIHRMGFHWQSADDFIIDNFKKDTATGSAVGTNRGHELALHGFLLG
jgi:hypothetical protein